MAAFIRNKREQNKINIESNHAILKSDLNLLDEILQVKGDQPKGIDGNFLSTTLENRGVSTYSHSAYC